MKQTFPILANPRAAAVVLLRSQPIHPAREHSAAGLGFQHPLPSACEKRADGSGCWKPRPAAECSRAGWIGWERSRTTAAARGFASMGKVCFMSVPTGRQSSWQPRRISPESAWIVFTKIAKAICGPAWIAAAWCGCARSALLYWAVLRERLLGGLCPSPKIGTEHYGSELTALGSNTGT